MAKEPIKALKAKIAPPIKKGATATGEIVELSQGSASDYMTDDQIKNRLCNRDDPYIEVVIVVEGVTIRTSMKDYTRIADGLVSPNTDLGKFGNICNIEIGSKIPMYAAPVQKNGKEYMVWKIVGL